MCNHIYIYPEDNPGNYNRDGKTLTGVCRCGEKERAYGRRRVIKIEEKFREGCPYGEDIFGIRNPIW